LIVTGLIVPAVIRRGPDGALAMPKWSLELIVLAINVIVVTALAPVIRRSGAPLLNDAFRLAPETGVKFSKLLDIAYYLVFGGLIIITIDLIDIRDMLEIPADLGRYLVVVARVALFMGLAHVGNLIALPVVGLVYGASVRRRRRRAAGSSVPEQSRRAVLADRTSNWIVFGLGALILALLLVGLGLAVGFSLGG
jgi:hypothetical protein